MLKDRIKAVQKELNKNEALFIESAPSRYYLTGFNSSAGIIFITREKSVFLIDFRYFEKAKETVDSADVVLLESPKKQLSDIVKNEGITKIFTEPRQIPVSRFNNLKLMFPNTEISDDPKIEDRILEMRAVKSETELSSIIAAQKLTDETFEYICKKITPGKTEREIMLDMEFFIRKSGSEGIAFDFIVVSGKNSSLPHGVPTNKKIEKGDFVTMDFGAVVNGYRSDMTRTVAVSTVSDEQIKVYNTVREAQTAALKAAKPGLICKDVDKIARDIINTAGYECCFGHGLGHSVGIEIHENPSFNTRCETRLSPGMIMTVEPGIYLENKFGVRIEDMIYITENGSIDLTHSPKELIVL